MIVDLSYAGAWIGIATCVVGIIVWIVRVTTRFQRLERQAEHRKGDNEILVRAMFAVLDGLKQQGANGPVTQMRNELEEYIIKSR